MLFANWLSSFAAAYHSIRKTRSRRRWHAQPVMAVEQLEDRSLLTPTVTIFASGLTSGVSSISEWNPANPGDQMALFTFVIDELQATDLTVAYNISGTATIGTDYTGLSASGSFVIPAGVGATSASLSASAGPDALVEGDETILFDIPSTGDYVGSSLTLTIRDNLAPVAFSDSASVVHDRSLVIPFADLLANDTDNENHPLTVTLTPGSATHGTAFDIGGAISFLPDLGFMPTLTDVASFTYTVSDGAMTSNVATVTIDVTNNAPVANADGLFSVPHNSLLAGPSGNSINISIAGLLANDTDADNDPLKFVFDSVTNGGVSPNFNDNSTPLDSTDDYIESLDFTPAPGFAGLTSIKYKANDGIEESNIATVVIDVTNNAPTAIGASGTLTHSTSALTQSWTSSSLFADEDSDTLTISFPTLPTKGTVVVNSTDKTFRYEANPNQVGEDSFVFSVTDSLPGTTASAGMVSINITNAAPIAANAFTNRVVERIG